MRISPMIEFPLSEYENRISELLKRMKAAKLDGMLISNRESTRYYCDLQSIIWSSKVSTPGILLINADGETALIGSASAVETARYTSVIDPERIIGYNRNDLPGIPATYPDAIISSMEKLGLTNARLGMELGDCCYLQLQLHWFEELAQRLPEVEFVDASDIIFAQRAVKSLAEIEMLSSACDLLEESLRFAFEHVTLDASTEADFFRLFAQEAFRRHCENVTNDLVPMSVLFGSERFHHQGCPYSDARIKNLHHAPLQASGGLFLHGYYANLTRTGVVGALSAKQERMVDAAKGALDAALTRVKDGASIAEMTSAADSFAENSPVAGAYLSKGKLGFGVGLDLAEAPFLKKTGVLRSGMVLSIGPRFGDAETGLFSANQEIAVTDDGYKVLSKYHEPYILR